MSRTIEIIAEFDAFYVSSNQEECYTSPYKTFGAFMKAHHMTRSPNPPEDDSLERVRQKIAVSLDDLKEFELEDIEMGEGEVVFDPVYKPLAFYDTTEQHPVTEYNALWVPALHTYLIIGLHHTYMWSVGTFDEHIELEGKASLALKEKLLQSN